LTIFRASLSPSTVRFFLGLALLALLPACVPPNLAALPPASIPIEVASFEVRTDRAAVVAAAQQVLMGYGLTPTLVDPAGGFVQSDYTSLQTVHRNQNLPDDLFVLDQLLLRVSVAHEARDRTVTVTTAFRPIGTADQTVNRDLTTFWLDQVTRDLATTLETEYDTRVTARRYMDVLEGRPGGGDTLAQTQERRSNALKAVGIIAGGLLVLGVIGSAL
jgi:hypothetical protein